MSIALNRIETEDVIVYSKCTYCSEIRQKCEEIFNLLIDKKEVKGMFSDNKWETYSGLKYYGLKFDINETLYANHLGKEFGISKNRMIEMLKCYAICCNGVFIYSTIARKKVNVIRDFCEKYADNDYRLKQEDIGTIEDFLEFINTPDEQIDRIVKSIRRIKTESSSQRKLSPIMNYLVIDDEINYLYSTDIDDETYKALFPIYFWVNITFILPLRATEMLVTPFQCIERKEGKVYLKVRRTNLKKGNRKVYYDVEKDYKIFTYEIPDKRVVENIEKYIRLTSEHNRRFLFEYNDFMVNDMVSLPAFNHLLAKFIEEYIVGNRKYDFVRYATKIKEFEVVSAGDSRPIAMANLYFQNSGEDICRQLADHTNIDTSSGYYTNISETILNSSIIQMQKRINEKEQNGIDDYFKSSNSSLDIDRSFCTSPKREFDNSNIDDCVEQGHMEDCIGCKFYIPSKMELDRFLSEQKRKADESAQKVIDFMNNTAKIKGKEISLSDLFLNVQTDATRYRMGCNIKVEETRKEWQKLKNSQKTFC